jgi:hypothetical protein
MVSIRLLLLGWAIVACSNAGAGPSAAGGWVPSDSDLRVVNATGEPLAFFAIAADLEPLLDPVPEIGVRDPSIRLVPAGAERAMGEISGRQEAPGGGVAVFLYALTADGTRARFTRVQLVSGEVIRQAKGRIVISQLGPR